MPSRPRRWANLSRLRLHSHRNARASFRLVGRPDNPLARRKGGRGGAAGEPRRPRRQGQGPCDAYPCAYIGQWWHARTPQGIQNLAPGPIASPHRWQFRIGCFARSRISRFFSFSIAISLAIHAFTASRFLVLRQFGAVQHSLERFRAASPWSELLYTAPSGPPACPFSSAERTVAASSPSAPCREPRGVAQVQCWPASHFGAAEEAVELPSLRISASEEAAEVEEAEELPITLPDGPVDGTVGEL